MPPTDNMPDFDSMSPEELMAWMETLAERQGATEGFTTESRVDIAEVDPTTMQDTGPGYIPYGMSEEQWAKKQEDEAVKKAARQAERQAQQQSAPPPAPVPVSPPAPEPEPAPAVASASSGDMPDFDSMSPEELMAWMETLAERQGATEGFTTESRVDIAEVDPTTMQDTGPGYIPYGMSEEQWAKKQEDEAAKKAARQAERQAQQSAPTPVATPTEVEAEAAAEFELPDFELPQLETEAEMTTQATSTGLDWLEDLAADQGADFPEMDLSGLGDDLGGGLDLSALSDAQDTQSNDPMSWLDGLAGGNEQAGIDLSFDDLDDEEDEDVHSFAIDDDDDYSQVDEFEETFDLEPASMGDFGDSGDGDEDPLNWLESLAREQGADPSEFTTSADFSIPDTADESIATDFLEIDDGGFSLDDIDDLDAIDIEDEADPVAWLEGLATQQSAPEADGESAETDTPFADDPLVKTAKTGDVMQKLQAGDVSSEDMRGWMDNLLSQGIDRSDDQGFKIPEAEVPEEDGELESNIPDWLVDQVGPPPDMLSTDQVAAFTDASASDPVQDIPDWLQDNMGGADDEGLAQIFETDVEDVEFDFEIADTVDEKVADVAPHTRADMSLEETLIMGDGAIDTNDPWVEAFELERTGTTPSFVSEAAQSAASILEEVTLPPETALSQGEPIPMPDWLSEDAPVAGEAVASAAPAVVSEMEAITMDDADLPDWLREMETQEEMEAIEGSELPGWLQEAGVEADTQVPDWLRDTVTEDESAFSVEAAPTPAIAEKAPEPQALPPQPVQQPTPVAVVPVASPAPVMVSMNADEAAAVLESARSKVRSGEVDAGMDDYESVIRANAQLDNVVNDLSKMVKEGLHKSNPVAHRVLGDGLMRLGRLQEALDTYRKALNLL